MARVPLVYALSCIENARSEFKIRWQALWQPAVVESAATVSQTNEGEWRTRHAESGQRPAARAEAGAHQVVEREVGDERGERERAEDEPDEVGVPLTIERKVERKAGGHGARGGGERELEPHVRHAARLHRRTCSTVVLSE